MKANILLTFVVHTIIANIILIAQHINFIRHDGINTSYKLISIDSCSFSTNTLPQTIKIYNKLGTFDCLRMDELLQIQFDDQKEDSVIYEGLIYHVQQIGSQKWLRENLNIGTMLYEADDPANNQIIEKHCYNDDTGLCSLFGGLYRWDEAMNYINTSGAKGICPLGWHIPTSAEFSALVTYVNGDQSKLKSVYEKGNNLSGFSALLGGARDYYRQYFYAIGHYGYLWSSNSYEYNQSDAYYFSLYENTLPDPIWRYVDNKNFSFSIRCIKDN